MQNTMHKENAELNEQKLNAELIKLDSLDNRCELDTFVHEFVLMLI